MAVLMTGGTGFLGLHLARGFLLEGRSVRLLAHAGGASAIQRVRTFLSRTGTLAHLPRPLETLLSVFEADVEVPNLGLSEPDIAAATSDVEEIWHSAATVMLDGRDEKVWRTNVEGTHHVLRLLDRTPQAALYRHVSTAFVVGQNAPDCVREEDYAATKAFENVYEHSKLAGETAVREWAARSGRSALILRPSILAPNTGRQDALPEHTLRTVGGIISRMAERRPVNGSRLVLRISGDPRARLNLVQVDWAADVMRRLSNAITTGIEAVQVVHQSDVPVRSIASALEDDAPVRIRLMPGAPADPTDDERTFYRLMTGFLPYMHHRWSFDTSSLRRALPDLAFPPLIDRETMRPWLHPVRDPASAVALARVA